MNLSSQLLLWYVPTRLTGEGRAHFEATLRNCHDADVLNALQYCLFLLDRQQGTLFGPHQTPPWLESRTGGRPPLWVKVQRDAFLWEVNLAIPIHSDKRSFPPMGTIAEFAQFVLPVIQEWLQIPPRNPSREY